MYTALIDVRDDIVGLGDCSLLLIDDDKPPPPQNPMPADRVRSEHIRRVCERCDRNGSETARRRNMHRRTMPRCLGKRSAP